MQHHASEFEISLETRAAVNVSKILKNRSFESRVARIGLISPIYPDLFETRIHYIITDASRVALSNQFRAPVRHRQLTRPYTKNTRFNGRLSPRRTERSVQGEGGFNRRQLNCIGAFTFVP